MLKCEVPKEFNSRTSDVGSPAEGVLPPVFENQRPHHRKTDSLCSVVSPMHNAFFFFLAQIKRNTKADHLGRSNECSVKMAGFTNFLDSGGRYFTL